jgi:hypothetical protein
VSLPAAKLMNHIGQFAISHLKAYESEIRHRIVASAALPTRFGEFRLIAFSIGLDGKEHVALVHGNVEGKEHVPVRMHRSVSPETLWVPTAAIAGINSMQHCVISEARSAAFCSISVRRAEASGSSTKSELMLCRIKAWTRSKPIMRSVLQMTNEITRPLPEC